MATHTYNASYWEAESGRSGVQRYCWLCGKFKASLGCYMSMSSDIRMVILYYLYFYHNYKFLKKKPAKQVM